MERRNSEKYRTHEVRTGVHVALTDSECKKACYLLLELIAVGTKYIKHKGVNVEQVINQTAVIEFACPMCTKDSRNNTR